MLRRIALENFKSWRKLDIELAPITLLVRDEQLGQDGDFAVAADAKADGREPFDPEHPSELWRT